MIKEVAVGKVSNKATLMTDKTDLILTSMAPKILFELMLISARQ